MIVELLRGIYIKMLIFERVRNDKKGNVDFYNSKSGTDE